jgi:hypothetical protein
MFSAITLTVTSTPSLPLSGGGRREAVQRNCPPPERGRMGDGGVRAATFGCFKINALAGCN